MSTVSSLSIRLILTVAHMSSILFGDTMVPNIE